MKKISIFVLVLCFAQMMSAQKMTDDQVVEYVMTAQEKGDSQQQIAKELLRRGVSMEQVNRIKRRMELQKSTGIGGTLTEKVRVRKAPIQDETQVLQGELEFLLSDSTMMYVEKEKKEINYGFI